MNKIIARFSFFILFYSFIPAVSYAQFADLHDFDAVGNFPNGANPFGALTVSGNVLFGTTGSGGEYGYGIVFSMHKDGSGYKTLFNFNDTLGANPMGSLLLSGTNLYGVTYTGGVYAGGTLFSIDTNGQGFTVLHNFIVSTGYHPKFSTLVTSGNKFYGLTYQGGTHNYGVLFSINANGSNYNILRNFDSTGEYPGGGLALEGSKLYGMTSKGYGIEGCIFTIDTSGLNYKTLWVFNSTTGPEFPVEGSVLFVGKTMFGMTQIGGANNAGCIFSLDSTTGAALRVLYSFDGTIGSTPQGGLICVGNKLFGMANNGGILFDDGGIFSLDTNGNSMDSLFFFNEANGANPCGDLILSGDVLYGMCYAGGYSGFGDIFSLTQLGLGMNALAATPASLEVYPNPSTGIFTVRIENGQLAMHNGNTKIQIYNILGEQVYSTVSIVPDSHRDCQFSIDLSSQPAGVYLCRIIANNGSVLGETKLLIQK